MEVKDLVSFYLNETTKKLDVTFRMSSDSDDEIRTDSINFDEIKEYGFDFIPEEIEDYNELIEEEYFDDEIFDSSELFVEEQEIINFLNEYYLVSPDRLPEPDLF